MKFTKRPYPYLLIPTLLMIALLSSCKEDHIDTGFYPVDKLSIAGFLEESRDSMHYFHTLLSETELLSALTAYNPAGNGYTLFLPSDEAFERFFAGNSDYSSMEELLADRPSAEILALYHILTTGVQTSDFPFGSLPDTTASGDYLTIAIDTSSLEPLVNGVAGISEANIELTNGLIHVIDEVLIPVTYDLAEWIQGQADFSLLSELLVTTGLMDVLSEDAYHTILAEPNSVFASAGMHDLQDLVDRFSPDDDNFSSEENGLYNFAAYHLIEGVYYLDDFEEKRKLYNTKAIYPLDIDGLSLVMKINAGVSHFDTLVSEGDTTIIDFIGFDYENSNKQAVNGALHRIDQVMELFLPEKSSVINQFYNEPRINEIRNTPGETVFRDQEDFSYMEWIGIDEITYFKSEEGITGVWNNDYIVLEGSFGFRYEIPRVLPGRYNFYVAAHAFDDANASIQMLFDGDEIGAAIDLTSGGTSNNPYYNFFVATLELNAYDSHVIELFTLIPGTLTLDRFTLEPVE